MQASPIDVAQRQQTEQIQRATQAQAGNEEKRRQRFHAIGGGDHGQGKATDDACLRTDDSEPVKFVPPAVQEQTHFT